MALSYFLDTIVEIVPSAVSWFGEILLQFVAPETMTHSESTSSSDSSSAFTHGSPMTPQPTLPPMSVSTASGSHSSWSPITPTQESYPGGSHKAPEESKSPEGCSQPTPIPPPPPMPVTTASGIRRRWSPKPPPEGSDLKNLGDITSEEFMDGRKNLKPVPEGLRAPKFDVRFSRESSGFLPDSPAPLDAPSNGKEGSHKEPEGCSHLTPIPPPPPMPQLPEFPASGICPKGPSHKPPSEANMGNNEDEQCANDCNRDPPKKKLSRRKKIILFFRNLKVKKTTPANQQEEEKPKKEKFSLRKKIVSFFNGSKSKAV